MPQGQEHSIHNPFTEEETELALQAMVRWSGNATATSDWLKGTGRLDISPHTLRGWKYTHAIRYDELREKYKDEVETTLAHEMRDVAALAVQGTKMAVERTMERLEAGEDDDPARSAANLSKVAQSSTDKLMTLTNRPIQPRDDRNAGEIIRSLAALGVIKIPDEEPVDVVPEPEQLERPGDGS